MSDEHTEARPAPLRGYRVLSEEEKTAVDSVKLLEARAGELWGMLGDLEGVDRRCLAIAKTELQTGFMWFVRAVTRPLDVFEEVDHG